MAELMESVTISDVKPSVASTISNLPRELLYIILFHCHQTHDVVREKFNSSDGESYLSIDHASGSRNLGRVCRLWKNAIEVGMVPARPFHEIQLSDQQFFRLVSEDASCKYMMASDQVDRMELPVLLNYRTLTIVCKQIDDPYPLDAMTILNPLATPKKLNIVITDGRTVDIREIFQHFKTPYLNLLESLHLEFLASRRRVDPDNDISIIVWDGRITLTSSSDFIPSLKIPIAMGRVDLSINHWTDNATIDDIPWIFGQLCRHARPLGMGFHLLKVQDSPFTDKWCRQRPSCALDNTFLREICLTGISSDGFLRLLQCASIEVWCVQNLRIKFLPTHDRELCYWDYRIFDKTTWPFRIENTERDIWSDYADFLTFPKLSLRRRLDGRIQEVEKQQMQAPCQIASPVEVDPVVGWPWRAAPGEDADTYVEIFTDVDKYVGRSLRWSGLKTVEIEGEISDEDMDGFQELNALQEEPFLEVLGPMSTGRSLGHMTRPDALEESEYLPLHWWAVLG
ncbi:uncharacterized protein H6S33_004950 [Morchella sextelata]|uniref:uncharacterized protein n=1 Tax=Morchella sextelata TaxID=1174677 RepID=UPI001D0398D2|nr:uncharacterized protein H6S33_004950 [Morchella sextelata]KAH0604968.1 hypothetical protein H6S33_004950 [Morchella sextelata]